MTDIWLDWCTKVPITQHSNGPFGSTVMGVVLHVNVDESGTPDSFYQADPPANPSSVTPNFQVYKSEAAGGTHQYLPLNWSSWAQADGNSWGPSIETAGLVDEPFTDYQITAIAKIYRAAADAFGLPYQVTDDLAVHGLGTHAMGGISWGGHPCPGDLRAAQRTAIIDAARSGGLAPKPDLTMEDVMALTAIIVKQPVKGKGGAIGIVDADWQGSTVSSKKWAGISELRAKLPVASRPPVVQMTAAGFDGLTAKL